VRPYLGDKPVASITTDDVQRMYNKIKKNGRREAHPLRGHELADSTVRGVHMMLHEAMDAPCAPTEPHPEPVPRKIRKSGTGCLYQINDSLWEGIFFPKLPNGKRKKINVYAETKEQCEIKLAEMIERLKAEIAEKTKRGRQIGALKIWFAVNKEK